MAVIASKNITINGMRVACFAVVAALICNTTAPLAVMALDATSDTNTNVSTSETTQALANTPGVLSSSDQTATTSDGDSAIKAATAGATVDIPKDPSAGVTLKNSDESQPAIQVSLPNADRAKDATPVANGTVAYEGENGSANAVQAPEEGGVRLLTVIDSPSAPTTYDYKVTVPGGGHIELSDDGGAIVKDSNGEIAAAVQAPWAKDATDKAIPTYFTTDGQTLTQHVEHNQPGVVYPVTADPWFLPALIAVAQTAAIGCAVNVAQNLIWQGAQWAIRRGDWNWTQKARQAGDDCAQGAVFGFAGRFIPAAYKQYVLNSIRGTVVNYLLWVVKR